MSCSINDILDTSMNKAVDDGVDKLAAKIASVDKQKGNTCAEAGIDNTITIGNMTIQYIILAIIILSVVNHSNSVLGVRVIVWVTYVSLCLVAVQYRHAIVSAGKVFLYGLDIEDQFVIIASLATTVFTAFATNGGFDVGIMLAIAFLISVSLVIQLKDFLLQKNSKMVPFLSLLNGLSTPERISKIYAAF